MEGLLAVSPYMNSPFDSRAEGVVEAVAAAALSDLNQLANNPYIPQAHALGMVPRGTKTRPQATSCPDEPAPAADDYEEATEAYAPSGRGDGSGFVLDW